MLGIEPVILRLTVKHSKRYTTTSVKYLIICAQTNYLKRLSIETMVNCNDLLVKPKCNV